MTIRLANNPRSLMASALSGAVDAGSGAGKLRIYSGAQPATAETAASGVLLAEVTLQDPAFGSPTNGVITLADPGSVTVSVTGTAGWFRVLDSSNATVFDGSVGTSGTDLIVATTSFVAGVAVDVQAGGTITVPAG